jgi:hypothetical protein
MTTTVEKILEKAAELEAQAAALRLAARVLTNGAHERKQAAGARTVAQAIAVRQAQRNGGAGAPAAAPPPAAPQTSRQARQAHQAERREKRDTLLTIIRDYGKPMPLAKLKMAAQAQGIDNLTGIVTYARHGWLRVSRDRHKATRYTFRAWPDDQGAPADAE